MFAEKVSVSANFNIISLNFNKGSFTIDIIGLGGGGGFQIMTVDDGGEFCRR